MSKLDCVGKHKRHNEYRGSSLCNVFFIDIFYPLHSYTWRRREDKFHLSKNTAHTHKLYKPQIPFLQPVWLLASLPPVWNSSIEPIVQEEETEDLPPHSSTKAEISVLSTSAQQGNKKEQNNIQANGSNET